LAASPGASLNPAVNIRPFAFLLAATIRASQPAFTIVNIPAHIGHRGLGGQWRTAGVIATSNNIGKTALHTQAEMIFSPRVIARDRTVKINTTTASRNVPTQNGAVTKT
jgi:hypothetical protein